MYVARPRWLVCGCGFDGCELAVRGFGLPQLCESLSSAVHAPQMHQLMPSLLSCVVGKYLCGDTVTDNHWALRHLAAQLVATICRWYGRVGVAGRYGGAKCSYGRRCCLDAQLRRVVPYATWPCGQNAPRRVCGCEEAPDDAVRGRCRYAPAVCTCMPHLVPLRHTPP